MSNDTTTLPDIEDGPFEEDLTQSLIILFTPFFIVPASIILFRLGKWAYRSKFKKSSHKEADALVIMGLKKKKKSAKIKKTAQMDTFEIQDDPSVNDSYKNRQFYRFYKTYLSPAAVRNYLTMTRFGRIWMVFQVLVTILSIINYVTLTYLAHKEERNQRRLVKTLDLAYAGVFLIDFVLSLYTAEDSLAVYFTWQSFIDLISIVTPFIVVSNIPGQYIWFIGMIRIFKATRINRTYKLLSFWQNEDTRELTLFGLNLFNFIFLSASIINATESLVQAGGDPSLLNWHDSLYYIMVTFSTIGFGDLTPNSTVSRVVVMLLITLGIFSYMFMIVVIYVPMQTSRIAELFNSMSHFQRASYNWTENHSHVILAGNFSYTAIVDFCREYFVSDPNGHIVVVGTAEPTIEVKRLLNHPFYRNRIYYLRGDVSSPVDSKRMKLNKSTGLFLFNVEVALNSNDSKKLDADILMQSLKIKTLEPGIPIFIQIRDKASSEIAKCSGADRVLCYEDISFSLMARTSFVPGIIPLLTNLVNSYTDLALDTIHENWIREYQSGAINQIESFRIPHGLVGVSFSSAAKVIFADYGACLFGIMSTMSGFNTLSVVLNPGEEYKLKETDIALVITESSDIIYSMVSYGFAKRKDWSAELSKYSKKEYTEGLIVENSLFNVDQDNEYMHSSLDQFSPENRAGKDIGIPKDLKSHIVLCNCQCLNQIRLFVSYIRKSQIDSEKTTYNMTPIVCIMDDISSSEEPEIEKLLQLKGIYFVSGDSHQLSTLSAARIESCRRVIIFSDKSINSVSESDSKSVFTAKLLKKFYREIPFLVELHDGSYTRLFSSEDYEWNTSNLRIQSILNNYEISSPERSSKYLSVRMECSSEQGIIVQIAKFFLGDATNTKTPTSFQPLLDSENDSPDTGDTTSFKSNAVKRPNDNDMSISGQYVANLLEQAELNESGLSAVPAYHFDRNFSAGMVSISSLMQSLLCQSYFRPYIIDVITKLCSELIQIRIPPSMIGREYGDFFAFCIDQGYIILGLYRSRSKEGYVFTNPKSFETIGGSDVAFALKKCNG